MTDKRKETYEQIITIFTSLKSEQKGFVAGYMAAALAENKHENVKGDKLNEIVSVSNMMLNI